MSTSGWPGRYHAAREAHVAQRDDERFAHVAAWEYTGDGRAPERHIEPLEFEYVKPSQRSYK